MPDASIACEETTNETIDDILARIPKKAGNIDFPIACVPWDSEDSFEYSDKRNTVYLQHEHIGLALFPEHGTQVEFIHEDPREFPSDVQFIRVHCEGHEVSFATAVSNEET